MLQLAYQFILTSMITWIANAHKLDGPHNAARIMADMPLMKPAKLWNATATTDGEYCVRWPPDADF